MGKSTEEQWGAFEKEMGMVQAQHVPIKVIGRSNKLREPWMTRDIQDTMRRKSKAFSRYKGSKSAEAFVKYRTCRVELKKAIRKAKRGDEKSLAGKSRDNPKIFLQYVNGKRVTRVRVGPIGDQGSNLWVEQEDIDRVWNEYFTSIFTQENEDDGLEFRERDCEALEPN